MMTRAFWAAIVLFTLLFLSSFWLRVLNGVVPDIETISQAMSGLAIALAGFFILSRRHNNTIGWVFVGIGISIFFYTFALEYARYSLIVKPGLLPLGIVFAWFSLWSWPLFIWPILVFLPLLYPDGHLLSARWRVVGWFAVANMVAMAGITAVKPGVMEDFEPFANPLGVGSDPASIELLEAIGTVAILPTIFLATLSLIMRFRQSGAEQRAQIKWFLFVAVLILLHAAYGISMDMGLVPEIPLGLSRFVFIILVAALAFAVAIAVLKYRLYDIDVIIRRTLQYTLITGLLALVYLGIVVVLQNTFVGVTGQRSQVVIVISTLTTAALFNPLRIHVQEFIDRRFYRAKYDAEQALAQFAATAREEVDMDRLASALLSVVEETMRPERVGLWLKPTTSKERAS